MPPPPPASRPRPRPLGSDHVPLYTDLSRLSQWLVSSLVLTTCCMSFTPLVYNDLFIIMHFLLLPPPASRDPFPFPHSRRWGLLALPSFFPGDDFLAHSSGIATGTTSCLLRISSACCRDETSRAEWQCSPLKGRKPLRRRRAISAPAARFRNLSEYISELCSTLAMELCFVIVFIWLGTLYNIIPFFKYNNVQYY